MTAEVRYTLKQLADLCQAELVGDPDVLIRGVASLAHAQAGSITFLSNTKYRSLLGSTRASAVIVGVEDREGTRLPKLICSNPYASYAKIAALFSPTERFSPGIHPAAIAAPDALIATAASIAAGAVIGAATQIGDRSVIMPGAVIGAGVVIGRDCLIYPNAVIYSRCILGDRVIIHSGAVIGADGFGMAEEHGQWLKIPQLGRVVISDDVEIGANTTIDRGALDDTVIEQGVKLDNQIQIGHNCKIGAHTVIAGCVGIAGSTSIGKHCKIGGAAMIVGHISVADRVTISGGTLVSKSILEPGVYTAVYPFASHSRWLRSAAHIRQLDKLEQRIRRLEDALRKRESS